MKINSYIGHYLRTLQFALLIYCTTHFLKCLFLQQQQKIKSLKTSNFLEVTAASFLTISQRYEWKTCDTYKICSNTK